MREGRNGPYVRVSSEPETKDSLGVILQESVREQTQESLRERHTTRPTGNWTGKTRTDQGNGGS